MRKRAFIILLLPLIIMLWIVGWSLFWTGSQNNTKQDKTTAKTDGIEITIAPLEECTAE